MNILSTLIYTPALRKPEINLKPELNKKEGKEKNYNKNKLFPTIGRKELALTSNI